jgi:hypothetical protein
VACGLVRRCGDGAVRPFLQAYSGLRGRHRPAVSLGAMPG